MSGYIVNLNDHCWLAGGIEVTCVRQHAKVYRTESAAKAALTRRRNATQRPHIVAEVERVDGDL